MIVDYAALDHPARRITLTLHRSQGGYYSVTDQAGRLYFPPSELDVCVRFMRAFAKRHDARLDEMSIRRLEGAVALAPVVRLRDGSVIA